MKFKDILWLFTIPLHKHRARSPEMLNKPIPLKKTCAPKPSEACTARTGDAAITPRIVHHTHPSVDSVGHNTHHTQLETHR